MIKPSEEANMICVYVDLLNSDTQTLKEESSRSYDVSVNLCMKIIVHTTIHTKDGACVCEWNDRDMFTLLHILVSPKK